PPDAAVLVSWTALAGSLFAVWWFWARSLRPTNALVLMLLAGLFPGAVYDLAAFPTSLALAALLLGVAAAERGRLGAVAACLVVAGLCYPTAWFAAAGTGTVLVALERRRGLRRIATTALWAAAGLGAVPLLMLIDRLAFGRFDAFFVLMSQGIPFEY